MKKESFQESRFGAADYWRMYKTRGIKLPVNYFFQAHLFDLVHGTDTHSSAVSKADPGRTDMVNGAPLYRCSWTSEIKLAFDVLRENIGAQFEDYCFIDIGCGKGKVVLAWAMLLRRAQARQQLVGIEYDEPFVEAARRNQHIMGLHDDIVFIHEDATKIDYSRFGKKIIVYLYNPFYEKVLRQVIARLDALQPIIVYNNPVYEEALCEAGYERVFEKRGWHPNAHTVILRKSVST